MNITSFNKKININIGNMLFLLLLAIGGSFQKENIKQPIAKIEVLKPNKILVQSQYKIHYIIVEGFYERYNYLIEDNINNESVKIINIYNQIEKLSIKLYCKDENLGLYYVGSLKLFRGDLIRDKVYYFRTEKFENIWQRQKKELK